MNFKIQYRDRYYPHLYSDFSDWNDWTSLGKFESVEQAIEALSQCLQGSVFEVFETNEVGIYRVNGYLSQFRFPNDESPWKVGLNENVQNPIS